MRLSLPVLPIFLIFLMLLLQPQAFALGEFKKYSAGTWEFGFDSDYFLSQNNYLRSGNNYDSLANGGSYRLWATDFYSRWNLSKSWALTLGTNLGVAESKDGTLTRNTSQFDKVFMGTDFVLYDGTFKFIPDVLVTLPLVKNDPNSNNVQTSEGATEVLGRIIARFDLKKLSNQVFVGSTYRDDGRSVLLNYGAGTELNFTNSYWGAEIRGYASLINDQNTSNPTLREATALRVNGGSYKFNSVNPSLLESNGWYRWDNGHWGLQVGAGLTITGTTQAAGYRGFLNFVYRFQPGKESSPQPAPQKSELERFREETDDGVDQILFQPQIPAVEPEVKPKKQENSAVKKPEIQIQLKSKPKKKKPDQNQ